MGNKSSGNANLQYTFSRLLASALLPCALPFSCILPCEHRKAANGTLYVVTDRKIYRLVHDETREQMRCTRYLSACRQTVSLLASTPSTAELCCHNLSPFCAASHCPQLLNQQ